MFKITGKNELENHSNFSVDSICGNSKSKKNLREDEKSTSFFIAFSLKVAEFWKAGVSFQVSLIFLIRLSQFIRKHNIFIVL